MKTNGMDSILALSPADAGYRWEVPEGWAQGHSTFGGLLVGAIFSAVERQPEEGDRVIRSANLVLAGAVSPGLAEISVRPVRQGKAMSTWMVTLTQGGGEKLAGTVIRARRRMAEPRWLPEAPVMPPFDRARAVPIHQLGAPGFTRHFGYQSTGAPPFSGADTPGGQGWLWPKFSVGQSAAVQAAMLSDAWWPGQLARERAPRPIATAAFDFHLYSDQVQPGPFIYHATCPACREGYFTEDRALYDMDGGLMALNRQLFVIIK